jgi:DNA-binding NtrC family response regulator
MAKKKPSQTITTYAERGQKRAEKPVPALFVVLECDRLASKSARYTLSKIDTVVLGRGEARAGERGRAGDERTLHVDVPDRRMSTTHARIERAFGKWMITDADSKNGTIVNGVRIDRVGLEDGDVIELGHAMLLFRDALVPDGEATVLDGEKRTPPAPGMATLLPSVQYELDRLAQVARSQAPIVLQGESGTGKEVIARAIHGLSGRSGAFVAVKCGAVPANLVESELFGHRKGAFSGAANDRAGHVRASDKGTLLLDELGDLPPPAQAALLRVLQESEVVPVGDSEPVPVDLRVIAATQRDLDILVSEKTLRPDLLARLSGLRAELPPLRERREDMGLIIAALVDDGVTLSREAARALMAYDWPLNIRELQKCLETAVALAGDGPIKLEHLPRAVQRALEPKEPDHEVALSPENEALRGRIISLLEKHDGNVSAVARDMEKARPQVHRWLKRFDIDPGRFRSPRVTE